jgi:mannitol/fructose-specific phosphotransferase system IIA component (Ntr-type)
MNEISGPEFIMEKPDHPSATEAIRELAELVGKNRGWRKIQVAELLAEVLRRHEKAPCGLGRGLAFPNARTDSILTPCLAVGLSRRGLDCGGKDGGLAHVLLLYIGHASPSEGERALLGRLSRALANPTFAERLLYSGSARELWEALVSIDQGTALELRGGKG